MGPQTWALGEAPASFSLPLSRGRFGDWVTRKDQTGSPGAWAPSFRKLCRLNLGTSCDHCSLLRGRFLFFWGPGGVIPVTHWTWLWWQRGGGGQSHHLLKLVSRL